jgi:hypothetical protein
MSETLPTEVYVCRRCATKMMEISVGDVIAQAMQPKVLYCNNMGCSHYGFLTVVARRLEIVEEPKKKGDKR